MALDTEAKGIILSAAPQGEYGRRLTILTDRFGKICVFAGSAAKAGSHLTGLTRPMICASFTLSRGRNAYNLHGARLIHGFPGLMTDFEASCYGLYFLELLDWFAQEGMAPEEAKGLLNLTYLGLSALEEKRFSEILGDSTARELIRGIYELRLLVMEGEYREVPEGRASEEVLRLWRHATGARLSALFLPEALSGISGEGAEAFSREAGALLRHFVPRKFRSLEVLRERP